MTQTQDNSLKMYNEKENLLRDKFKCIEEAMELDSDASDKAEILIGLQYMYIHI